MNKRIINKNRTKKISRNKDGTAHKLYIRNLKTNTYLNNKYTRQHITG